MKLFLSKTKSPAKPNQPDKPSMSPRSSNCQAIYDKAKSTGMSKSLSQGVSIREWRFWRLINNDYPYDMLYKTHHMLIPKRVVTEPELNQQEQDELKTILQELENSYDSRLINFSSGQSIHDHFHIHLLIYKDSRSQIKL